MTLSPTDQPTNNNQPDSSGPGPEFVPTHYVSLRVTLSHSEENNVISLLGDAHYIMYPHLGKAGDNPHYHILIVTTDAKDCEKYRLRFKRAYKSEGNEFIRVKFMSNGILNAITYCAKEGTKAIHSQEDDRHLIDSAPAWEERERNIGGYLISKPGPRVHEDHFKIITLRNIEKSSLRFRQRKGLKTKSLSKILAAMHNEGYRLDSNILKNGIPAPIYEEFEAQCSGTTTWTVDRFDLMRVPVSWRVSI